MSALEDLQEWYLFHCDGDWEETNGVDISTTDQPGWRVEVDLAGTALENVNFKGYTQGSGGRAADGDWLVCLVKDKRFIGTGGVKKLDEIIAVFVAWAKMHAVKK